MMRWFRRLFHRSKPRLERCETCNVPIPPKRVHEITVMFDDTDPEIAGPGGSSMSAIYCPAHCPGGCQKENAHASAA